MTAEGGGDRAGGGHAGDLEVEGNPHDLVVDEGSLGTQPVGAAHVAVVGGEDDHGVVPRPCRLEGGQHNSEVAVGQPVEVHVVVEMAQPGPFVGRVDHAPQTVLLVPTPLPVGLGFGEEVVVEVGGELVDHFGIGVGEDGEGVVVLPGGRLEQRADGGHVVGVALLVARLIDRKPHDVVGIDQGHGEEPGVGPPGAGSGGISPAARGVAGQPLGGIAGDDRVEVHAGPGPPHEVAIVAVPVGEAVGLHVRGGRVRQVPLADVGGAVAGAVEDRPQGRGRGGELGVLGHDHVVEHAVALEVPAGEQAGPARRAGGGVGEVVGELEALGPQPVPPGQGDSRGDPGSLPLLVGDDQQDVGTSGGGRGHGEPR